MNECYLNLRKSSLSVLKAIYFADKNPYRSGADIQYHTILPCFLIKSPKGRMQKTKQNLKYRGPETEPLWNTTMYL